MHESECPISMVDTSLSIKLNLRDPNTVTLLVIRNMYKEFPKKCFCKNCHSDLLITLIRSFLIAMDQLNL